MARRRVVTRGGARRKTSWVGPADQSFLAVTSSASIIVQSFDPAANALVQPTVVRTRGTVVIAPAASPSADLEVVGAYGGCIITRQAFAAGVGSIPHPIDEGGWDGWFVWNSFALNVEFGTAVGTRLLQIDQTVDSKAMRKVTDNEVIVFVAGSAVNAFRIAMPLRMLLKIA